VDLGDQTARKRLIEVTLSLESKSGRISLKWIRFPHDC